MANSNDNVWARRGEQAVGAATDLVIGVGRGFASIGSRLKRSQYQAFADGLCAVAGDVASQNGRLKAEEIQAFRNFVLSNREHPAVKPFDPEDLTERFKDFAIKAFLCDDATFARVIDQAKLKAEGSSELGEMVLLGALAIAYADGDCDEREQSTLQSYADRLTVDLPELLQRVATPTALPESLASAPSAPAAAAKPALPSPSDTVVSATARRALSQGEKLDLPSKPLELHLEWDPAHLELDICAFVLGSSGKVEADEDFVFYNQPRARGDAVVLEPQTGQARLRIDPSRLPAEASVALAFALPEGRSVADLERLELNVGETAYFEPTVAGGSEAALILGRVYARKGAWRLEAVGQGFAGGLAQLAGHYGVNVA